jgi:hypothetical protein
MNVLGCWSLDDFGRLNLHVAVVKTEGKERSLDVLERYLVLSWRG